MDKASILNQLKEMIAQGEISKAEVLAVFATSDQSSLEPAPERHFNLSEVMYYIGGGIVFAGIVVLAGQHWDSFNSAVKILLTFGSAVVAYVVGALLLRYQNLQKVAQAFFLIAGLLSPLGMYVLLNKMGIDIGTAHTSVAIFAVLTAVYYSSFYIFRKGIFTLFSIVFASALFIFLTTWIGGNNLTSNGQIKLIEYVFLGLGSSYILLGKYFTETSQRGYSGVLYAFGSLSFLGAALALGGYSPTQNWFWELAYPLLVFGIIFVSVQLKSKALLVFGSLFLIGYIGKLTGEYFSHSFGWPLSLVIAGLLIMLVGYYTVKINRQYLTTLKLK